MKFPKLLAGAGVVSVHVAQLAARLFQLGSDVTLSRTVVIGADQKEILINDRCAVVGHGKRNFTLAPEPRIHFTGLRV